MAAVARVGIDSEAVMNANSRIDLLTRDAILGLLTDAEVAKVSTAEDAVTLIEGDRYIDLLDLEAGIQEVQATPRTAPGHALPRSAVSDASWQKIVRAIA
jgi:hypothetical protein